MFRAKLMAYCLDAIDHYGGIAQAIKCREECRELDHALTEWHSGGHLAHDCPAVIDEIADVLIMAEQMRIQFGDKAVDDVILSKIDRQRARMAATPKGGA